MRSRQIGRRVKWREPLVDRLRYPKWRRRSGPYLFTGEDRRIRFYATSHPLRVWTCGPLLVTQWRIEALLARKRGDDR